MQPYDMIPDDWYQETLDEWKAKLAAQGYPDAEIAFRGFGSQGDGASFTCPRVVKDWPKLLPRAIAEELQGLKLCHQITELRGDLCTYNPADWATEGTVRLKVVRTSHQYCHEHTVSVDIELGNDCPDLPSLHTWLNELVDAVTEEVRRLSREIYSELDEEYFALWRAAEKELEHGRRAA